MDQGDQVRGHPAAVISGTFRHSTNFRSANGGCPVVSTVHSRPMLLRCISPFLMLWTAPPPALSATDVGAVKAPTVQRSYSCKRSRQSVSTLPTRSRPHMAHPSRGHCRIALDTARARNLPVLTYSIDDVMSANVIWTCPPMRSVSAGAPPRYGTCESCQRQPSC